MKKAILVIVFAALSTSMLYAQDSDEAKGVVTIGKGLTKKQIGNFSVIAAEDARVTTDGKTVSVEDMYEYTGRKFKETEARLKKIEAAQDATRKRVKQLAKDFANARRAGFLIQKPPKKAAQEPTKETIAEEQTSILLR